MSKIIVIAGTQAAGKSTVIAKLSYQLHNVASLFRDGKAPLLFPLQESRQIIVHKHMLLGAIFMTPEQEREVVSCDFERMDLMLRPAPNDVIYLDECNVFTIAHAAAHGVTDVEQYWDGYMTSLRRLDAAVIFLDVPVDISWDRRRRRYEQRLVYFPADQHEHILQKYYDYIVKLHPLLLDLYRRLPFPKTIVDSCCSEENVLEMVCQKVASLTLGFG